ncbi:MAG: thrombospondin type 3 repeat-containing protein [Haloarculaceae archaeon]
MTARTTTNRIITVVAVLVLVASVVLLWQLGHVRARQATTAEQSHLVAKTVTTRHAPNDYDGDGVPDATDRCPTRPETTNGFQDGDGCPDVVATTGAS